MGNRLQNKIAIITGASRGIGEAMARAFAAEAAKVVIVSRKAEDLAVVADAINAEHPGSVFPRACHVGQVDAVKELVAWVQGELGVPDVLVNNAGTNPYFGPMIATPDWAWDKTFEVNLKGYFTPLREVATRMMAAKKPGSIINVASVVGMRAAVLQGVYGMTKAAIISMTQTLSVELGSARIRVNAIAPGLVDTRLSKAITASVEASAVFTERSALKRIGRPEEMAGVAVFLASDESSYITGQTLAVDGGYTTA